MDNKGHWESVGADYSASWSPPAKDLLSRKELDFVSRHISPDPVAILDVGVGNGRILDELLKSSASAHIYGIDVAESMLSTCRARFSSEPRVMALSPCDISRDPVPFDQVFDFITAIRVLKYSSNWPDIAARLVGLVSAQGILVFSMPNRHSISRFSRSYAVPWETTTRKGILDLCTRLGVEAVEMRGFGRLPFFVYNVRRARATTFVMVVERWLDTLLGPTALTRELFVAVRRHGGPGVLAATSDRLVTAAWDRCVVEKTFLGAGGLHARQAEEEFDRLRRLHTVVVGIPGAASPRPSQFLPGPPPRIDMAVVPGRPLLEVLRSRRLATEEMARLAATASKVLTEYVAASQEAYLDFQFDNMLYDEPSATLGFLDLGAPHVGLSEPMMVTALELSLGNLVGSTIFQSARPRWLLRRRQHRQAADLCAAVVLGVVTAAAGAVSVDGVQKAAGRAYRQNAFRRGWYQGLWYATGGYVLARRMQLLGATFGPVRGVTTS